MISSPLDKLCIDTIRVLAMDGVQKANSGHPGAPMGQAPAAYALWTRFLKHNPLNPQWPDRDRFVLSGGHASMLMYSLLHLAGYDLSLDDLKAFRQWGSKTPGHPEFGHTAGVETTTGPLGQGVANAVGMALAERLQAAYFNRPGHEIVNHHTFAFCGDGDLMEGLSYEAASLAGHLGLEKLILLYDDNQITIEGHTDLAFSEDVTARFESMGWRVFHVEQGEDLETLEQTFQAALEPCGKPTLIRCHTIIGYPAPTKQNTHEAHGAPLGEAEISATKEILGFDPNQSFQIPEKALNHWRNCQQRGQANEREWQERFDAYRTAFPQLADEFELSLRGELPKAWETHLPSFEAGKKLATREASGAVLNALAAVLPQLVGGSADLAPSTNTYLKGFGDVSRKDHGRNFHWGIREHAMGSILNGMSLHGGFRVFGATFLVFSDYMRPAVRLASLMKQPVIYVWTHDSIGLGEDGPTHQPIEHVMSLRLIPGLHVIRPAEATETAQAWRCALERKDGPTALVLTRQKMATFDPSKLASAEGLEKGAYVLSEAMGGAPKVLLLATGSETTIALEAQTLLQNEGIPARVVSMPCWERFEVQDASYKESVLPSAITARVSIEAGVTTGWQRWIGHQGKAIGLDHFGASAPAEVLYEQFGLSAQRMAEAAKKLLSNQA